MRMARPRNSHHSQDNNVVVSLYDRGCKAQGGTPFCITAKVVTLVLAWSSGNAYCKGLTLQHHDVDDGGKVSLELRRYKLQGFTLLHHRQDYHSAVSLKLSRCILQSQTMRLQSQGENVAVGTMLWHHKLQSLACCSFAKAVSDEPAAFSTNFVTPA